jgi:hypothetical protein
VDETTAKRQKTRWKKWEDTKERPNANNKNVTRLLNEEV